MDNQFFRQCFPYKVAVTGNTLVVFNRQPNKVFEGYLPKRFDKDKLFSRVASGRPDCIRDNECFLYDDETNPVSNELGFSKSLFNEYEKRLLELLDFMRGIEPVV